MKLLFFAALLPFGRLVGALARPNRVAGVWGLVNATFIVNNEVAESPYGDNPHGMISLTETGWFVEQINSVDRNNSATETVGFGISGSYNTDENGDLLNQTVLGCTNPDFIGDVRYPAQLWFDVAQDGQTMQERFVRDETTTIYFLWARLDLSNRPS
ncbi:hypothetical protein B0I35DRAFT_445635 [Stachybotrys elegans]|uniref:Lipocalin-like domain-containing protein n=1 Tax=Stachybotrys elegans TaxID=80388 RepID=A0A8K0SC79_9HYPO|nr:hypothetical protein B0I35DRAFT_445635 [Stachybotrys elegans]